MNKFVCLALLAALAACSGNQQQNSSSSTTTQSSPAATMAPMKTANVSGASVYNSTCASCHQPNGKGLAAAYPPLAGNPVVTGNPAHVIDIVSNGLNRTIKVGAQSYNGMMPAWKGQLKANEIAAVITYIRSSWGNHASAVTQAQVTSAR